MKEEENKILNLQQKSHELLLKILNNIGIIGAILACVADIVFVIIFVVGVSIEVNMKASIVFAVINALIGVLINILLRFQGQKYAEIENQELCNKFYKKEAEVKKSRLSMTAWQSIKAIEDILLKGGTTVFGIFGIVYLSVEGSKNPVQILLTIVTLILFSCFGLINMNSSYCRFYNIQVPYMELKLKEKGDNKNGTL